MTEHKEKLKLEAVAFLDEKARPYSRKQLCDIVTWGGEKPEDRFYSEVKVVDLLSEFTEQNRNLNLLSEAKEVIRSLLICFPYDMAEDELDSGDKDIVEKAEQFIKEIENEI